VNLEEFAYDMEEQAGGGMDEWGPWTKLASANARAAELLLCQMVLGWVGVETSAHGIDMKSLGESWPPCVCEVNGLYLIVQPGQDDITPQLTVTEGRFVSTNDCD
jgi:hypothetical protein